MSNSDIELESDPYSVALTLAMAALGRRAMSKGQISEYLSKRGTPDDARELAIARLEEMGYLDDVGFARATCDRLRRTRRLSRRALINELRGKRVSQEVIDWVIEDYPDDAEFSLAREFAEKRWRNNSNVDAETLRRRISAALLRKGFPPAIAIGAVKELG